MTKLQFSRHADVIAEPFRRSVLVAVIYDS
jgi:hypothetical protein